MSEGKIHTPPELEVPELDLEAQLILCSGPMRSGKTTAALTYAWDLQGQGYNVMAFRPEQDLRHQRPQIESQVNGVEPFLAQRMKHLGSLALHEFSDSDVLFLDEPFMWFEEDMPGVPHSESLSVVQRAISLGAKVLISTLDKSYMEEEFEWHRELMTTGEHTERNPELGGFQHVLLSGVCELCPDEPELWQPSVSTNLYVDGQKQTAGSPVIPEDADFEEVYVPCCEGCRDSVLSLHASYQPRFAVVAQ